MHGVPSTILLDGMAFDRATGSFIDPKFPCQPEPAFDLEPDDEDIPSPAPNREAMAGVVDAAFASAISPTIGRQIDQAKAMAVVIVVPTPAWVAPVAAHFRTKFGSRWHAYLRMGSNRGLGQLTPEDFDKCGGRPFGRTVRGGAGCRRQAASQGAADGRRHHHPPGAADGRGVADGHRQVLPAIGRGIARRDCGRARPARDRFRVPAGDGPAADRAAADRGGHRRPRRGLRGAVAGSGRCGRIRRGQGVGSLARAGPRRLSRRHARLDRPVAWDRAAFGARPRENAFPESIGARLFDALGRNVGGGLVHRWRSWNARPRLAAP